ncbi:DUF397 domain-containing protein [Nocardia sp. CC227C]|uniref:DUF397 domain-containing protein n=1 Tax=Nocardia sp. CC227C TaxID=3044562 RepID=UPI00278BE103|nr:DUF397 domain-containing protein [Nocardia sp. CC227C]
MSTEFFKSTFSGGDQTCVEVAHRADSVLIRDSKFTGSRAQQPILSIAPTRWRAFLDLVLTGDSGAIGPVRITVHPDAGATIADEVVALTYDTEEWDAFRKGVAGGEFDRPEALS